MSRFFNEVYRGLEVPGRDVSAFGFAQEPRRATVEPVAQSRVVARFRRESMVIEAQTEMAACGQRVHQRLEGFGRGRADAKHTRRRNRGIGAGLKWRVGVKVEQGKLTVDAFGA